MTSRAFPLPPALAAATTLALSCLLIAPPVASAGMPAQAASCPSGVATYAVGQGDSWFGIAGAVDVSTRSLLAANGATEARALHPGDVVCLPAGATTRSSCSPSNAPTYSVVSGDTWFGISERAGVTMRSLLAANGAADSQVIHPGDELCLPGGASIAVDARGPDPAGTASGAGTTLDALPMQGPCWFGDSWHAPRGNGRRHLGVDMFAKLGSNVYAVVDGTLTGRAWDQPGRRAGNAWRLTAADGSGTYFFYAHLGDFAPGLGVGSSVEAGQVIGFMGNTGNSAFPHLHFEIHPNGGSAVNPYPTVAAMGGCKTGGAGYRQPGGWIPNGT